MNKIYNKGLALILSFLLVLSVNNNAQAATSDEGIQPFASDYLSHYSAYVYSPGDGKIEVWFTVHGNGVIDEIGALTIVLRESTDRENWSTAKTFRYRNYDGMLFYNRSSVSSHVEYSGEVGTYYSAIVTVWGGSGGKGDSRQITTYTIQA